MTDPAHVFAFETSIPPRKMLTGGLVLVDTPYQSGSWGCFEAPERGATSSIWQAGPHPEPCKRDFDEMCLIL